MQRCFDLPSIETARDFDVISLWVIIQIFISPWRRRHCDTLSLWTEGPCCNLFTMYKVELLAIIQLSLMWFRLCLTLDDLLNLLSEVC